MANSITRYSLGLDKLQLSGFCAPRTPGTLGINDQADPFACSLIGDVPGPTGLFRPVLPTHGFGLAEKLTLNKLKVLSLEEQALVTAQNDPDLVRLAAVAYGEAHWKNIFEEMAAVASVCVRQSKARGQSFEKLIGAKSTFAFAASDNNPRTAAFRKASATERIANPGMAMALKAATDAMNNGPDYSNGAYFWDGDDFKKPKHPKRIKGFKYSKPEHDIFKVPEVSVDETTYTTYPPPKAPTVRGKYNYVYESTAAIGGTIFWKYGADYIKASGNKIYD